MAEPAEDAAIDEIATEVQELSRYTLLNDCTLRRSATEEAGFLEHECLGECDFRLRHTESDLRDNVVMLAPDGGEHGLGLSPLKTARSAARSRPPNGAAIRGPAASFPPR